MVKTTKTNDKLWDSQYEQKFECISYWLSRKLNSNFSKTNDCLFNLSWRFDLCYINDFFQMNLGFTMPEDEEKIEITTGLRPGVDHTPWAKKKDNNSRQGNSSKAKNPSDWISSAFDNWGKKLFVITSMKYFQLLYFCVLLYSCVTKHCAAV